MSTTPLSAEALHHHSRQMRGRDPHEAHRVATPLELLFDLTFVTAFGLAASHFAHALAEGHYAAALFGFGFASFSICWAWINFSRFALAYDTDEWLFRVITMVQMIGVLDQAERPGRAQFPGSPHSAESLFSQAEIRPGRMRWGREGRHPSDTETT
jgi:hypothetical protein